MSVKYPRQSPLFAEPKRRVSARRKIVLVALLLLVLAAGAAWIVLRPLPAPPPVLLHPSAKQVSGAEARLGKLGQAVSGPGRTVRTLRLSESDLNIYLAGSRSARKLLGTHGVEAVQIVLKEPDGLVIHARVHSHNQTQNIQIEGTLAPDPKLGVRFAASHAQVGSLPLPSPVVTAAANTLSARFSRPLIRRLSLSVQSVGVQKKMLVITGVHLQKASPLSKSPARH